MAAGGNSRGVFSQSRPLHDSVRSLPRHVALWIALAVVVGSVIVPQAADATEVQFSFEGSDFYVPRPADSSDQVGVYRLVTTFDLAEAGHSELIGQSCRFTVMAANADSIHENNFGAIVTGGDETDVYETESLPNVDETILEDATLTLGTSIDLFNIMLPNADGRVGTSVDYLVTVRCGQVPPPPEPPVLESVSIVPAVPELSQPGVVDITVSVTATGTFDQPIVVTVDAPAESCSASIPPNATFPWTTNCSASVEATTTIAATAVAVWNGETQTERAETTITVAGGPEPPPTLDITIAPSDFVLGAPGDVEFTVSVTTTGDRDGPIVVEVDEPAAACGGTIPESAGGSWDSSCTGYVARSVDIAATATGSIDGTELTDRTVASIEVEPGLPGTSTVTGLVFVDTDANGRYDTGERLISGVGVSVDGRRSTTSGGAYRIETTPGVRTVSIDPTTIPTGLRASRTSVVVDLGDKEAAAVNFALVENSSFDIELSTESPDLVVGETIPVTILVTGPDTNTVPVEIEAGPGLEIGDTQISVVPGVATTVDVTGVTAGETSVTGTLPGGESGTVQLTVAPGQPSPPDRIQGEVYVDTNGNGRFDEGDQAVLDAEGWVVAVDFTPKPALITRGAGLPFPGLLAAGSLTLQAERSSVYQVRGGRFDVDAAEIGDYVLTPARMGGGASSARRQDVLPASGALPQRYVITVSATGQAHRADFIVQGDDGSGIAGMVFADTNGDCVRDPGEETIVGIGVRLQGENRDEETVTGTGDGPEGSNFRFNAAAGSYLISLDPTVLGPLTIPECGASSIQVVLDDGTSYETVDFPISSAPLGRIGGTVWCDLNRDNKRHPLEKEIPGVTVVLSGDTGVRQQTLTQSGGGFEFGGLLPGTYQLQIEPGSLDAVSFADEQPVEIVLGLGESRTELLALCQADQIPGSVFMDGNGNGVQDEGEDGIPDVLVERTGPDGVSQTTRTGASGDFVFPPAADALNAQTSLATGTHVIQVTDRIELDGEEFELTSAGSVEVEVAPGSVTGAPVAFGYRRAAPPFPWWLLILVLVLVGGGLGWLARRPWPRTQPPLPAAPPPFIPPVGESPPATPYHGARPFRLGETPLAGRDRDIRALESLTYSNRILVVCGPTGAGKTSLIQAGYIPTLDSTEFEVLPVARFQLGPGGAGRANGNPLVFGLLSYVSETTTPDALSIGDYLRRRPEVIDDLGLEKARVIVVDEFQEMFRLYRGRQAVDHRNGFFDEIEEALDSDPLVRFVFCIDEDEMGELDPYIDRFGPHIVSDYRVEPLAAPEALEAITEPARLAGGDLDPAAATALVDNARTIWAEHAGHRIEVESDRVDMLGLQVSAEATWQNANGGPIDLTDVLDWEDGAAALRALYDSAIGRLESTVDEQRLRAWCEHTLITPDGHRAPVPAGDLSTAGVSGQVIEGLLDAGILVETHRGDLRWYELGHDLLIDAIRQSNRMWREHDLLGASASFFAAAARMWQLHGRSDSDLLSSEQLEAAERWAAAYPDSVGRDERAYLDASIAAAREDLTTSPGPSVP